MTSQFYIEIKFIDKKICKNVLDKREHKAILF